jgi:hypothetical protein
MSYSIRKNSKKTSKKPMPKKKAAHINESFERTVIKLIEKLKHS